MQKIPMFEDARIRLHGRFNPEASQFYMDHPSSGIEFKMIGDYAEIDFDVLQKNFPQRVMIEVDGIPVRRARLDCGENRIVALDNRGNHPEAHLIKNTTHHIRVIKEGQPFLGPGDAYTICTHISIDGELTDLPARKKVECIGDSLTVGEGTISPPLHAIGSLVNTEDWTSSYYCWTGYLSRLLDVDIQVIAQGGWGVYSGWNNDVRMAIPSVYDKICGQLPKPVAQARGAHQDYNFSFDPDIVVVNLGTNDKGAFTTPAWINPADQKEYKMRRINEQNNPDSSIYHPDDIALFKNAVIDFAKTLTEKNPRAHIFWTCGMMGTELFPAIKSAGRALTEMGYTRFHTFELPIAQKHEFGANHHPLAAYHARTAQLIADKITPYFDQKLIFS